MRIHVVYDSMYGNTRKVAERIAETLSAASGSEVVAQSVGQADAGEASAADLLLLGAPTHGSEASEGMRQFVRRIGAPSRDGAKAATFDTRLTWRFLAKYGYAADKLAATLQGKGWTVMQSQGGFLVGGLKKGPLKRGELERAKDWAAGLLE